MHLDVKVKEGGLFSTFSPGEPRASQVSQSTCTQEEIRSVLRREGEGGWAVQHLQPGRTQGLTGVTIDLCRSKNKVQGTYIGLTVNLCRRDSGPQEQVRTSQSTQMGATWVSFGK